MLENNLNEEKSEIYKSKQYLIDTDYIANKIIEYQFLGKKLDKD